MKAAMQTNGVAMDSGRIVRLNMLLWTIASLAAAFAPRLTSTRLATSRHAFLLNTAFEWLAVERSMDNKYGNFSWFNPSDRSVSDHDDNEEIMPLYPLGATYLPSMTNHTLINVEPRNIQMVQDLKEGGRFCVTLAASDSGRLASVGTVMRILELEPHECEGEIKRVIVKCCAERLVDICGILNPKAANLERRLLHPRDYLKARVRQREVDAQRFAPVECGAIVAKILNDYHWVRTAYLNGVGTREIPPFALEHLSHALPEWNVEDLSNDLGFWDAALVWQTLCYTVREGRQINLSADRNELMVAAASAKGGPLKLPIHVADLSPADRFRLQELERQAQSDFLAMGLDPCLDFQVMIAMSSFKDRLEFLSKLISRERRRLEEVAMRPVAEDENSDEFQMNRTGAWFEGFE